MLRPVIDQNLYYAGLKFTSPTFSCAMSNMLPAMTFVMAVLCRYHIHLLFFSLVHTKFYRPGSTVLMENSGFRMEKLDMKKVRCQAKLLGTIVTVAGAMLMTLYKGHVVNFLWSGHVHAHSSGDGLGGAPDKDWLKGSIFLIIATLAWASFFILQVRRRTHIAIAQGSPSAFLT